MQEAQVLQLHFPKLLSKCYLMILKTMLCKCTIMQHPCPPNIQNVMMTTTIIYESDYLVASHIVTNPSSLTLMRPSLKFKLDFIFVLDRLTLYSLKMHVVYSLFNFWLLSAIFYNFCILALNYRVS
jgi:hypothetical protein